MFDHDPLLMINAGFVIDSFVDGFLKSRSKMRRGTVKKVKECQADAFIFHRRHRLILRRQLLHRIVLGNDADDSEYFVSDRVLFQRLDDALKLTQVRNLESKLVIFETILEFEKDLNRNGNHLE